MKENQEHLQDIKEIRSMMERSTRFLSLSGLSGVFAGVYALAGVAMAYLYFNIGMDANDYYAKVNSAATARNYDFYWVLVGIALTVLTASILTGLILTYRRAQKQNTNMWDNTSKRMLVNLSIPLVTGGVYCFALLAQGEIAMVAPATLIFYGLALINASKYTLDDIRYLGICEIVLGLIASVCVGYGLVFWAIGFGVLHIIYGTFMYYKYERE